MDNEERFILGIQTSPNVDGMTATMTNAALKSAEEFGLPSRLLNLRKMNILDLFAVTQRNKARQQELLTWAGRSLAESTLRRTRPDQSAFA